MQQLAYFLQKYKYFLFFVFLELIALSLTINNLNFHKSKFVSSANSITGGLLNTQSNISDYFHLKKQNNSLIEENIQLKNKLEKLIASIDTVHKKTIIDTVFQQNFSYIAAKINQNQYHKKFNFLTIDKGINDSVFAEMAVTNGKGIIGITDYSSKSFTRVQSILNKKSKINARLKNSYHFGTLTWDGKNPHIVQLIDIPRQAIIKTGDTIITGGKSTIFPEGIPIGIVKEIKHSNSLTNIDVALFNDMTNIKHVYVIQSFNKKEVESLENTLDE